MRTIPGRQQRAVSLFYLFAPKMLERILLIDDSDDDSALLQMALKKAGLQDPVFWIRDAEEGMAYLRGDREYSDREKFPLPNVLLLDLRMPKISGLDVLAWVKGQPRLNRLLVILVTHWSDAKVIGRAYQLGALSYLNKDGNAEEFEGFVEFVKGLGRVTKPVPCDLVHCLKSQAA